MAFDYTKLRSTALKLLTKFGADQTLTDLARTVYTVKAVFLPLEKSSTTRDTQMEFNVESTERVKCIFYSTTEISPVPGWKITRDSETLTIVQVTEINPTGTQIIFDCIVER